MTRKKGIKSMADDAFTKLVNETPAARRSQKTAIAKVDASEASFDAWFVAQYGEGPTKFSMEELRTKVFELEGELNQWRGLLGRADFWEETRDHAFKAWCARKDQK